jgi:CRP-like cAMP-binding protein
VTSGARLRQFTSEQVIVREGEQGDAMFAIVKGNVEVRRADADGQLVPLATLSEGAFFGEMALLSGAARIATVVAVEDCTLLEFGRADMQQVVTAHPSVGKVLERFHRRRLMTSLVRSSEVFRVLPAERREELAAAFRARTVAKGTVILQEGTRGEAFYMVLRGTCAVSRAGKHLSTLGEGGVFGEMSLLLDVEVTATVTATTPCTVLRLTRAQFESLVLSDAEAKKLLVRLVEKRKQEQFAADTQFNPQASW